MKKRRFMAWVMLAAILLACIPQKHASANAANFFIPNNATLARTANMDTAGLDRTTAMITNSGVISITGTFQQVVSTSLNVTIEQIMKDPGTNQWQVQPGKTATVPVAGSSTSNQFTANNVQLFSGYNRLTFSGSQGSVNKTDVFYVLYDTAPLLNSLTITSNSQTYNLNEGASLVLTSNVAFIQGSSTNATSITVNGQKASGPLEDGSFYAPAVTLTPGLNTFDLVLSNATDTLTLKRQVYYYDGGRNPFTIVDLTQTGAETKSILGASPTFTGTNTQASLKLQFLVPYQNVAFDNNSATISINGNAAILDTRNNNVIETVIVNTYGQPAYKLITLNQVDYTLTNIGGVIDLYQLASLQISYTPGTPAAVTLQNVFSFNVAAGQTLVSDVSLIQDYDVQLGTFTTEVPLDGAEVASPDFYVSVKTSKLLTTETLKIALQPLGNTPVTIAKANNGNSGSTEQVFKISGLPEGKQTVAFSVDTNPVSFTANVNYVSKNFVFIDNLYDGQIFTMDSTPGVTNQIGLSGKIIGFGTDSTSSRLLGDPQLLINNKDYSKGSTLDLVQLSAQQGDGSYNFGPSNMDVDRIKGPLYFGENTIKFVLYYSDGTTPGNPLRKYEKQIKFYILDKNVPDISNVRPLTAPTIVRGNLVSPDPSVYLPASPEFQFKKTYYSTTLSKMDLFIEGSGATRIVVKEGGAVLYAANIQPGNVSNSITPDLALYATDFYGNQNNFRFRLNDVLIDAIGTHVYTIELTNINGATASQTLEIHKDYFPYRLLAPAVNANDKVIVNKNFVLFDVEAYGATDVLINGQSATQRTDIPSRYVYTLIGLKPDAENKINLVIKRDSGDIKDTVLVTYVTDPAPGTMYMEKMGSKHITFNKGLQLSFPKNTIIRRSSDNKVQPTPNLLFGLADPGTGSTEIVNDYGQKLGTDRDSRTTYNSSTGHSVIPISGQLYAQFSSQFGRNQFTTISPYYWISGGLGEQDNTGTLPYKKATDGIAPYSTEGTYTAYNEQRLVVPSERGTLTLKYDDSVVGQAGPEVSVFYLGNDGLWKNLGGDVDAKAHTVTVPFDNFGFYMVGKLKYGFNDVTNHGWARDVLQALFAKGYMPNLSVGAFGTDNYTTRGEFAAILVRSLGLKLVPNSDLNNSFIDIIPYARSVTWNYSEIETAARAGVVQGMANRVFAPEMLLTRQDAAVMIARALQLSQANKDDKLTAKLQKAFADADKINFYAQPAVDAINSAGIMVGSPVDVDPGPGKKPTKPIVNFNPTSNLSRAEAGQISVRLLQKANKLPKNLN